MSSRIDEYLLFLRSPQYAQLFKKKFRLEQETFNTLCDTLKNKKMVEGRYPIEIQLMLIIRLCATGNSYSTLSSEFDIPMSSIGEIIQRMVKCLLSVKKQFIFFSHSINDADETAQYFKEKIGCDKFNMVAGCLDGTLCKIKRPKLRQNPNAYRDRKGNHSINVQAICDHKKTFLYVNCGFPGSCHDSWVWKRSSCFTKNLFPPGDYAILADSGYFLCDKPLTLVPYKKAKNTERLKPEEFRFNESLKQARKFVEMAFGLLKQRWRILLDNNIECSLKLSIGIIFVCFILHNLCMRSNDEYELQKDLVFIDGDEEGDEDGETRDNNTIREYGSKKATLLRKELTNYISRIPLAASVPHLDDHQYFGMD